MRPRRRLTISLPPPLFKQAEELAREDRRTTSALLREAFRFYVEMRDARRAMRERAFAVIDAIQARTKYVSADEIRAIVREAVSAARDAKRCRASATALRSSSPVYPCDRESDSTNARGD